ncbi:hypothetical protein Vadar_034235 [Vaccinium darrowii]|uniref:Uncharacterized protein n=1 Tax=Vaccinium darrowii TaxID=229202 RepID=A0ACB7X6R9_9ERIC|nr:hypothetical protein Vadar_034235 [Vaccinium darrowii]
MTKLPVDMEVILLSPTVDFNFESACSSPNITSSPSSPTCFNNRYFSAPTSPTPTSPSSFRRFDISPNRRAIISGSSPSHCGFNPNIPKPKYKSSTHEEDDNFEFHFSKQLEKTSLPAADELFHGGIIKPLKPPPTGLNDPLKSPTLPINAKNWKETVPVRHKKCDLEKLAAAIEQSRNSLENQNELKEKRERGRERTCNLKSSSRKQRGTRSLSPFNESCKKISNSLTLSKSKDSSSKKWKLRDLWLKKSNKEELKYSVLKKSSGGEDAKESSFSSTESGGGGGLERRRGLAERHYAAKRAAAEEMRKKTVLPYKHGLLGCMGFNFNPAAVHEISRGIDSLTRG